MADHLTLDVVAVVQGGDGLARHEGQVVFVPGALPGERVEAVVRKRQRGFLRAELREVVAPSASRRALDCEHEQHGGCGGCGFRHVADADAFALKAGAAQQALERISKRPWPAPVLHPAPLDGARRRVRYHLDGPRLGLYRRGSHEIVEVPRCLAASPAVTAAAACISRALADAAFRGPAPDSLLVEDTAAGVFAAWHGRCPASVERAFAELVAGGALAGAVLGAGGPAPRYVGAEWIDEVLPAGSGAAGLILRRRPGTFSQANAAANAALRELVARAVRTSGARRVLDLYAGSGNLTLALAPHAEHVAAAELEGEAVAGLRAGIALNALSHVEAVAADLRDGIPTVLSERFWDAVVLDPPRTGARSLMASLAAQAAPTLVYVSCAPACLARDVAALGEDYAVDALHAVDMFPRTPHLELVAVLRRRSETRAV